MFEVPADKVDVANYHIYNISAKTNDWKARINGNVMHTVTSSTVMFGDSDTIGLSRNMNDGVENWTGYIVEVIFLSNVATDAERSKINYYLSKKWGLESIVDSDADGYL